MDAAACPNKNCSAYVDINLNNCQRCGTGISPRHRNCFAEAMTLTKSHLDNMKEIACKFHFT